MRVYILKRRSRYYNGIFCNTTKHLEKAKFMTYSSVMIEKKSINKNVTQKKWLWKIEAVHLTKIGF